MHGFRKPEEIASKALAPGVTAKIDCGRGADALPRHLCAERGAFRCTLTPHEQMGMMVSGTMEFTIARRRACSRGSEIVRSREECRTRRRRRPGGRWRLEVFSRRVQVTQVGFITGNRDAAAERSIARGGLFPGLRLRLSASAATRRLIAERYALIDASMMSVELAPPEKHRTVRGVRIRTSRRSRPAPT